MFSEAISLIQWWFLQENRGTFFVNFFSQIPFPKSHFLRNFGFWKLWFLFSRFPLVYHHWNHTSRVKCDSPFPFHTCQMWIGEQTWIGKRNLRKMCPCRLWMSLAWHCGWAMSVGTTAASTSAPPRTASASPPGPGSASTSSVSVRRSWSNSKNFGLEDHSKEIWPWRS